MSTKTSTVRTSANIIPGLTLTLTLLLLFAGSLAAQQKSDDIPDAPSATRPVPPPPPPSVRPGADDLPDSPPAADANGAASSSSTELPRYAPDAGEPNTAPPPMPPIKTVPSGS